jgi:histidine triad (HIT) family protein
LGEIVSVTYDSTNIFSQLLRGEADCVKVTETPAAIAIMDLMPQSDGHVLVIPKAWAAEIDDLSEDVCADSIRLVHKIVGAVKVVFQPDGVFVAQYNGAAAGQTVPHVHFHVIPRWQAQPMREHAKEVECKDKLTRFAEEIRRYLAA